MPVTDDKRIVINIGQWQMLITLFLSLSTLVGTVWTATKWAVRDQVDAAVDLRMDEVDASVDAQVESVRAVVKELGRANDAAHAEFAKQPDLTNLRELLEARLEALEKVSERVEYLYRRELERNSRDRVGG